jgi:hypothetical protein
MRLLPAMLRETIKGKECDSRLCCYREGAITLKEKDL